MVKFNKITTGLNLSQVLKQTKRHSPTLENIPLHEQAKILKSLEFHISSSQKTETIDWISDQIPQFVDDEGHLALLCSVGSKIKVKNTIFWDKIFNSIINQNTVHSPQSLVTYAYSLTEIYHTLNNEQKSQYKIAIKKITDIALSQLKAFNIEQLCILVKSSRSNHFVNQAFLEISENRTHTRNANELVQLIYVIQKFFNHAKLPTQNLDKLVVENAKLYIEQRDLQPHEYAQILNHLVQIKDCSQLLWKYLISHTQYKADSFSIHSLVLLVQALGQVKWHETKEIMKVKQQIILFILQCIKETYLGLTSLQASTMLQALSKIRTSDFIDVNMDRSNSIGHQIQECAEIVFVQGVLASGDDLGFVYLLLNNLSKNINIELINEELIAQTLLKTFNIKPKSLEGRVLSLMGIIKVRNIELWLFCEKIYTEQILQNEEVFKSIEGLIGMAIAHRGTISLLKEIQQKIKTFGAQNLKFQDIARAIYGISLLTENKIDFDLISDIDQDLLKRYQSPNKHSHILDLLSILQGQANLLVLQPTRDTKLIEIVQSNLAQQQEGLNNRIVLSVFEVYGKIEIALINTELLNILKEYFLNNYYKFTFEQFSQITKVLRVTLSENKYLEQIANSILEDGKLEYDPQTMNALIKLLKL